MEGYLKTFIADWIYQAQNSVQWCVFVNALLIVEVEVFTAVTMKNTVF
jgi:hypothetical protein